MMERPHPTSLRSATFPRCGRGRLFLFAFSNNAAITKQKAHYKSLPLPQRGKVADHREVG